MRNRQTHCQTENVRDPETSMLIYSLSQLPAILKDRPAAGSHTGVTLRLFSDSRNQKILEEYLSLPLPRSFLDLNKVNFPSALDEQILCDRTYFRPLETAVTKLYCIRLIWKAGY